MSKYFSPAQMINVIIVASVHNAKTSSSAHFCEYLLLLVEDGEQ